MSEFKTEVVRIKVKPHENADRLEIAQVGEFQSIVGKGQYETGDLVAYIQEGSVVPDDVLEDMGLKGKLAGSRGNRVKAARLRGVLSQGLCYPAREGWEEGQDVSGELGIEKYEPPVPKEMDGQVYSAGFNKAVKYDIENFKRYPDVLEEGEPVVMTEKIHGSWAQLAVLSEANAHEEHGRAAVISKGLGSKGLLFMPDAEENKNNVYLRAFRENGIMEKVARPDENVFVLGEVYGVQDLKYDAGKDIGFRVFDVRIGHPNSPERGRYLNHEELTAFCEKHDLKRVPVLYEGPFSKAKMLEVTDGPETVSGEELHIREGIVVRPQKERRHDRLGRVQLKSVSEDYLTRQDGTEYN